MFIGHFAAAFASRRVAPRPSLGWLFAACQFPDLLWPILVLAGVERLHIEPGNTAFTPLAFDYYPWSHSLLMDVVWGGALGCAYFARRRDARGAAVIGFLVVSHWVLDWITHRPDMPLLPDNHTRVGLGLWNNAPATIAIELAMFIATTLVYSRMTAALDRAGRYGLWALLALLYVIYVANALSPPPPSANVVAISALALWLLVPGASWIDRHRSLIPRR